jgi:hypothetical protein
LAHFLAVSSDFFSSFYPPFALYSLSPFCVLCLVMYVGDDESFSHKMTMKENKLNQKPKIPEKEFHSNEQIILLYCCCFFQFGTYSQRIKQKETKD